MYRSFDKLVRGKPRALGSTHTVARKLLALGATLSLACTFAFTCTLTGCAGGNGSASSNAQNAASTSSAASSFTSAADYINQDNAAFIFDSNGKYSDMNYIAGGNDENVLRVRDANVQFVDCTINKEGGDSSNPNASLEYGLNAAVLAAKSSKVELEKTNVATNGSGACAIVSYGTGSLIQTNDGVVTTTGNDSAGLRAANDATMEVNNMGVTTKGERSAAIGIGRGGGNIEASGGIYTTTGIDSPTLYTADEMAISDANLSAVMSPAMMVRSGGKLEAVNCLTDGNTYPGGAFTESEAHAVVLFGQGNEASRARSSTYARNPLGRIDHMAASDTAAQLEIEGGTLTSRNGDMFFVTNTAAQIVLENVSLNLVRSGIVANAQEEALLRVCGNNGSLDWGTPGNNGAVLSLIAKNQQLSGDIVVDSISSLALRLENGSNFEGSVNAIEYQEGDGENSVEGEGDEADRAESASSSGSNSANSSGRLNPHYIYVEVDEGCTWNLTGNCTLDTLVNNGTINTNGFTITLSDGTIIQ